MSNQPKLVNKQFNTPIGLYSEQNIKEVIQREQQILSNGAVGVNFYNPQVGKPSNLQNSAVLRMLEEEEHRRSGHVGIKRVAWPPPQEGILDPAEVVEHSPVQAQGGPVYSTPGLQQNNYSPQQGVPYQKPTQPSYRPLKPLDVSSVGTGSPLASPSIIQTPQGYRTATPTKGWAPVQSPVSTPSVQKYFGAPAQSHTNQPYQPGQGYQQSGQQYQGPGQQYGQPAPQYQAPSQYQQPGQQYQPAPQTYQPVTAPRPQAKFVEPPPSTITLRSAAPVSQAPAPVYSAQPATASLKGGKNLRGDLKWPPENVRQQMAEENRLLIELAKGPAVRPLKKERDYTPFFEQHALNSTYPGYKIPPGTQFYRPE